MALALGDDAAVASTRSVLRRTIFALMGVFRLSQTKTAEAIGMKQPALSQRLNGNTPFDEDELARLAALFTLTVADLYNTEDAIRKASMTTLWIARVIHNPYGVQGVLFEDNDDCRPDLRSA